MSTESHRRIGDRLGKLTEDVARLGICTSESVKLVLFATECRFGHLVEEDLVPGWKLVSHCNVSDPALLAGYIFSRKVIRLIGGEGSASWSRWQPPVAPWPEKADFKSREGSYRYLRLEVTTGQAAAPEKCVLFVNFCDATAKERLEANEQKIEGLAQACIGDCAGLCLEDSAVDHALENYSAITRMIAPVARSDDPHRDLHKVLDYYLENILIEIDRRRRDEGLTLGPEDLHASIHSTNLLSSKSAKKRESDGGIRHCTVIEAHAPGNLNVQETQPLPWKHDAESKKKQAGFVAFALTFGQALLLRDLTDPSPKVREWKRLYRQVALSGASSVAVAPIFLEEGKLWGALNLESTQPGAFRQEDMFFLLICVRLLAVQIEQFLENRRNKNQNSLLQSLSSVSRVKPNGQTAAAMPHASTATRVAQMMCDQFRADQVIISPRCRTLWPILEPVVWPGLDALPFTLRKDGYTSWITESSAERELDGIWVTRSSGEREPLEVRKFRIGHDEGRGTDQGGDQLGRREVQERGCVWEINPEDGEYNTLVGLSVRSRSLDPCAADDEDEDEDRDRGGGEIGAVVWVKNRMTIPYSSIRASELAHMAKWLEAFLTLHQDFNMERVFETPVFSRTALESYLQRARHGKTTGVGHPNLMAFLDIDNFRWVNAMCGYAEGTRIIKEVVGGMADAAREIEQRYRGEGRGQAIYFDIYRYGGDEFVLLGRLGRAGGTVEGASEEAFRLFEEWDRVTRDKLKDVPVRPQKEGAAAKKGVSYSLGVTKDLPGLIRQISEERNTESAREEGYTEKLVRYLGACVRIAKKGQGTFDKTVVFEDVKSLVQHSLPETRKKAAGGMSVAKVLVPNQLVILDVGEDHKVRPGMRFQVLHDATLEGRGLFTDGQDLPKADLEVTEVWSEFAQAKASRVAGTIEPGDRVIIRLE